MVQLRRNATEAGAAASTYVPLAGEPLVALDTGQIRIGDGTRTWPNLPRPYAGAGLNVKGYATVQAAVDAGATLGLPVFFPAGRYVLPASVNLPDNADLRGAQGAIIDLSVLGTNPAFQAVGTAAAQVLLSVDAAEGAKTVTLVDASTIAAGDWVKIASSTTVGPATDQPIGEIQRVRSVSGNVLTFPDPLSRTYTTAATASVQKLTQRRNISVRDLAFEGVAANTAVNYQALRFDTVRNVSVSGCSFKWVHYVGVGLTDTVFVHVTGCHFEDAIGPPAPSYGVGVWWASQDVTITGCTGIRLRHVVTCGGGTSRRGTPRRVTVTGCTATECIDAAFDAHTGCDDFTVTGCHVLGGGLQDGIISQGRRAVITGNTVIGVPRHGIIVQGTSIGGLDCTITGNKVSRVGGRGILVQGDGLVASHRVWGGVTVTGNNVTDTVGTGIEVMSTDVANPVGGATVEGNTVRRPGNHGILVNGCLDAAVAGNHVFQPRETYSGIYVLSSPGAVVTGNAVNGDGVALYGIRLNNSATHVICSSNRVRGCGTGIAQDSTSGPGVFTSNITVGNTAATTLSAAGNVVANNL